MAEISGVITLGIGPTTVVPIAHFVLFGLNPSAVTGTPLALYAHLQVVGLLDAELDVVGGLSARLDSASTITGVLEQRL